MYVPIIRNKWLADLLSTKRELITDYWIEDIRAEDISGYRSVPDEVLRREFPPTVDSMIYAFETGDTEGPRRHSLGVIRKRLANGLRLPDLQMSLHALETAVMRIVRNSDVGLVKEMQALQSASTMYYLVAVIAAEVYEHLRLEQQIRFSTAYEFGLTLSSTLDLSAILRTAVSKVAEYANAESVAILLKGPKDKRGKLREYVSLDDALIHAMPHICTSICCGDNSGDDQESCEGACVIPDLHTYENSGDWARLLVSHKRLSLVCTPLNAKQQRLGSMIVLWEDTRAISNAETEFLSAMGGHIANAVQNATLYEEAKGKRELGLLLESSRLFTSSLDTLDILHKVAKMATDVVGADISVVLTKDHAPDKTIATAYYARSEEGAAVFPRIAETVASGVESEDFGGLGRDFTKGKGLLYRGNAKLPKPMQSLADIGGSWMIIPLKQKDHLLGAFVLMSLAPNGFISEDLSLAMGLAELASTAIENARLYEYERHIAETLQRSFLPASLPKIEGYEAAAYYRPAMAEAVIGGDFYDMFGTGDGNVSFIIGDVSGKGLKAAIPTIMGRFVVRAYTAEGSSPADVMRHLNRTFIENAPEGFFMTAFSGTLNRVEHTIRYVNAGHDRPLLFSAASGQVGEVISPGICIGFTSEATFVEDTAHIEPGDVLLLYTDGATDVKGDSGRLDVEGLSKLLSANAHLPAEEIVRNISDGIWNFSDGRLSDDVALVVLKRLESP